MSKKLFLFTLLLLILQTPQSIAAMEGEPDWTDSDPLNKKTRSSGLTEWVKDKVMKPEDRSDATKAEKLRQAIREGDQKGMKEWGEVITNPTHIKLALKFAQHKFEDLNMKTGQDRDEVNIAKRKEIHDRLKALFEPKTPPVEKADVPSPKQKPTPASPPVTPRAVSVDPVETQIKTLSTPDITLSERATQLAESAKKRFGLDAETHSKKKQEEFMLATKKGDLATLTKLLALKDPKTGNPLIDINAKDSNGDTALMLATKKGDIATLKALLTLKDPKTGNPLIDVNEKDSNGDTALMLATRNGDLATLKVLLALKGRDGKPIVDVNEKDNNGETALMLATKKGDLATLTALLALKDPKTGNPLVDVNAQNNNDDTALMIAVKSGKDTTFTSALFSVKGIDLNVQNSQGETVLVIAAEKGNENIVIKIIDQQTKDIADKKKTPEQRKTLEKSINEQYRKAIRKAINSETPDMEVINRLQDILEKKQPTFKLSPDEKNKLTTIENQATLNNQLQNALEAIVKANKTKQTITPTMAKEVKDLDAKGAKVKVSDPELQAVLAEFKNKEVRRQKQLNSDLALELDDRNPDITRIKDLEDQGATIDPEEKDLIKRLADIKSRHPEIFRK